MFKFNCGGKHEKFTMLIIFKHTNQSHQVFSYYYANVFQILPLQCQFPRLLSPLPLATLLLPVSYKWNHACLLRLTCFTQNLTISLRFIHCSRNQHFILETEYFIVCPMTDIEDSSACECKLYAAVNLNIQVVLHDVAFNSPELNVT